MPRLRAAAEAQQLRTGLSWTEKTGMSWEEVFRFAYQGSDCCVLRYVMDA